MDMLIAVPDLVQLYNKLSGNAAIMEKLYHPKSHKPTNCVNCGAPLHSHKCEFCDTEYDW